MRTLLKTLYNIFVVGILKCLGVYHFWGIPSDSFLGFKSLEFKNQVKLRELHADDPNKSFPTNIKGSFFRANPGKFEMGISAMLHFFDGLGMIHAFYFDQGKVLYQSKFLEAKYVTEGMEAGYLTSITFNTTPFTAVPNPWWYPFYMWAVLKRKTYMFFHIFVSWCKKQTPTSFFQNYVLKPFQKAATLVCCCLRPKKKSTSTTPQFTKSSTPGTPKEIPKVEQGQELGNRARNALQRILRRANVTEAHVRTKHPHLLSEFRKIMQQETDDSTTPTSRMVQATAQDDDHDHDLRDAIWFYNYALQTNVAIVYAGDNLLVTTDGPIQTQFDGKTLETIKPIPFKWDDNIQHYVGNEKRDAMDILTCSHASWDPNTDYYYNFFMRFQFNLNETAFSYAFFMWNSTKRIEYGTCEAEDGPRFTHCTALTENYFLLPLTPIYINLIPMLLSQPVRQSFEWHQDKEVVVYVIDRKSGKKVGKFYCGTFFFFHTVSAFEDTNGNIVIDFSAYPDDKLIDGLLLENVRYHGAETVVKVASNSHTIRAIYKVSSNDPHSTTIYKNDPFIEFPKINDLYSSKPFTHSYGVGLQNIGTTPFFDAVYKLTYDKSDVTKPPTNLKWVEEGCYCTEPIFMPFVNSYGQPSQGEDDGVVISIILDTKREKSFLLVLDAKTFQEICRYYTPTHIPFGNHGMYTPINYQTKEKTD